jgi:cyanate permease
MNPITKLAAVWFPVDERATASGIASIAGYIGIIVAMIATPALYQSFSMPGMLRIYGFIAVAAAVAVIALLREKPKIPAGPRGNVDDNFSLRKVPELRKNRNFMYLLLVVFIALGVFNALLTCISDILHPRGLTTDQSGLVGGVIIIAGLVGGVVIPLLSDKLKKRRVFLIFSVLFGLIGMAGLSYINGYILLLVFAGITGFFIMGAGPMIFQYGTELAYPTPEGTAYGLLMGSGQVSGIAFILLLNLLRSSNGSMALPMTLLIALMALAFMASLRVKESSLV